MYYIGHMKSLFGSFKLAPNTILCCIRRRALCALLVKLLMVNLPTVEEAIINWLVVKLPDLSNQHRKVARTTYREQTSVLSVSVAVGCVGANDDATM